MHLKIQVVYGNLDVQLLKDGTTYSAGESVYDLICILKQQFQCTVHKKKGLLGLSSLLFERGAPEIRVLTI